ncbi:hypothetical protein [Bacteroides nordii]|uniref:hypothetical protein n=1 Tax=Bacteroides nordii TaxID=291645 RepID=UPI00352002D2
MQTKKKNPVLLLLFAGLFYGSFITAQTYSLDSQAEEFYVNQIQRLDSICTVSDSDKKILREYFVSYLLNNADPKWSFQLAMSHVTTNSLCYLTLFKDDMMLEVNRHTYQDILELQSLVSENDTCFDTFIPFIRHKNEELALLRSIYVTNDSLFTQKSRPILSRYDMQVKNFTSFHFHLSKNYDIVLKYRLPLQLTDSQTDSIVDCGKELKKYMIRNTNYDHWKHERTNLRKILSEKQYDMFLTFKHWSRSYQAGLYYWDALKKQDSNAGMDSAQVVRDVTNYHVERSKLFDMYAYDDREKYNLLARELYRNYCPVAVRRVNEAINREKNYQGSYTW